MIRTQASGLNKLPARKAKGATTDRLEVKAGVEGSGRPGRYGVEGPEFFD
jgi:hypothetical protein